jgi:hypothetical protein
MAVVDQQKVCHPFLAKLLPPLVGASFLL